MIRILIADEHAIVRRGLREIFNERTGMVVLGEADNPRTLFELLQSQTAWDVVLLDANLGNEDSLEHLESIKQNYPALPVIILDRSADDAYALRALKAGVSGCLTIENTAEELVNAIRKVIRGGVYISRDVAEKLALSSLNGSQRPDETLSPREYYVLVGLASGKSIKEMAHELSLSQKTVSTYRERILDKLALRHNADIVRYALEHKLIK